MFPGQVTLFDGNRPRSIAETMDRLVAAKIERVFSPPGKSLELVSGRAMSEHYQAFYDELLAAPWGRLRLRGSEARDPSSATSSLPTAEQLQISEIDPIRQSPQVQKCI
jgi:hypothetical protein